MLSKIKNIIDTIINKGFRNTELGWATLAIIGIVIAMVSHFEPSIPWMVVMPVGIGMIRSCVRFFALMRNRTSQTGVWGTLLTVGATWVNIFRCMTPLLRTLGAFIALALLEQLRYIPPEPTFLVLYVLISAIPRKKKDTAPTP